MRHIIDWESVKSGWTAVDIYCNFKIQLTCIGVTCITNMSAEWDRCQRILGEVVCLGFECLHSYIPNEYRGIKWTTISVFDRKFVIAWADWASIVWWDLWIKKILNVSHSAYHISIRHGSQRRWVNCELGCRTWVSKHYSEVEILSSSCNLRFTWSEALCGHSVCTHHSHIQGAEGIFSCGWC